ncbi:Neuropeptide FF receptor 2 [Gryllus bimaculatus]|nr:Neuropeptide FF receptor 2 [Gryllus bimaculatus]
MAVDRYMCMLHPVRYHKHSRKKYLALLCTLLLGDGLKIRPVNVKSSLYPPNSFVRNRTYYINTKVGAVRTGLKLLVPQAS